MEGQGFRDRAPEFAKAGIVILGISFDTPEENRAFAQAQAFPYRLLSDADHVTGRQYGAERGPDEQYSNFSRRLSFLVDPEGVIRKRYEVTDPAAHPAEILADIGSLRT